MKKVLLSLFMVAFLLPFAVQAQSKAQYDTIIVHDTAVCDSFLWIDGVTYTDDATVTFANATNDTLHFLNLTVWKSTEQTLDPISTDCGFRLLDTIYFNSGEYTYTGTTVHQCDSIIHFNLTVNNKDIELDSTVLGCTSYSWKGISYKRDTAFIDTIKTPNQACDSIVNLTINIKPLSHVESFDTIVGCDAVTVNLVSGSQQYTETSDVSEVVLTNRNVAKCFDSTLHHHIIIYDSVVVPLELESCGSYVFEEVQYTESVKKNVKVGKTSHLCDSIVALNLKINPHPVISIEGDWQLEVGDNAELHAVSDLDNCTYVWKYDGKTIKDKDAITIENIQKNTNVELKATSEKGCESDTWLTITTYVDIQGAENAEINIYPNPTSRFLNIESNSNVENVSIYNVAGQQIINTNNLGSNNNIDLNSLTNGNYTIRMTLENGTVITKKFIINK